VFERAMKRSTCALACTLALLALAPAAAIAAAPPAASTTGASAVSTTTATLNGTVNPEGQPTSYYFQYGTTTAYGGQTATVDAGSGTSNVNASASISSLSPATTYHYRLVATYGSGTTLGADRSFTTDKLPAPVVVTLKPRAVTATSAKLAGGINPKGQATSYYFQYGTTSAFGSQTPTAGVGAGTTRVNVLVPIDRLKPGTTYHFRVVASNASGTSTGNVVTFTSITGPGGVTILASPTPIVLGRGATISGQVLPPRTHHLTVALERASSPFGPWLSGRTTAAGKTGAYSFPGVAPASNSWYRADVDGVVSRPLLVLVRFRVEALVSTRTPARGSLVRFHGRVAPGHRGHLVFVQGLGRDGRWHTMKFTRLRGLSSGFSFYSVRVPIDRSGLYRVVVRPDRSHARGRSRVVHLRVH
jgi:hypothetical protein